MFKHINTCVASQNIILAPSTSHVLGLLDLCAHGFGFNMDLRDKNNTPVSHELHAGGLVVGALVVGASVPGALVVGASVVGALVVGASVAGALVVGALVVGALVVGASVVGALVVGA